MRGLLNKNLRYDVMYLIYKMLSEWQMFLPAPHARRIYSVTSIAPPTFVVCCSMDSLGGREDADNLC